MLSPYATVVEKLHRDVNKERVTMLKVERAGDVLVDAVSQINSVSFWINVRMWVSCLWLRCTRPATCRRFLGLVNLSKGVLNIPAEEWAKFAARWKSNQCIRETFRTVSGVGDVMAQRPASLAGFIILWVIIVRKNFLLVRVRALHTRPHRAVLSCSSGAYFCAKLMRHNFFYFKYFSYNNKSMRYGGERLRQRRWRGDKIHQLWASNVITSPFVLPTQSRMHIQRRVYFSLPSLSRALCILVQRRRLDRKM